MLCDKLEVFDTYLTYTGNVVFTDKFMEKGGKKICKNQNEIMLLIVNSGVPYFL